MHECTPMTTNRREFLGHLTSAGMLGVLPMSIGSMAGAIEQWEATTQRDPNHGEAQRLLRQAQAITQKSLEL